MSDCCAKKEPSQPRLEESACPVDGHHCKPVELQTMLHHLNQPWAQALPDQRYYFCDSPACDVVYFGQDGITLNRSAVHTVVGIKEASERAPLCYCFGVSKSDAQANPAIRTFVMEQTKKGYCTCATSNPSGRCCLKNFPREDRSK
ncbi:hypothetical protein MNBD_GAMMA17-417 [hydrothermal vent metagenome]|uniref:CopZ zinc binding domain-containing protein n=1 Tax=hydrothermal vent metagenome TaxID=652676 RepID=A0A3B0Z1N8_9ZZZZ